ncbi:hypothetical protein [Streptomyces sp. DSM 40750]|uniref:hypothetical protein n=1 Tax=Streptomyces sp. DSM 40750 TaxID=2801030 RepID=UPI00214BB80A|nr:hypothetical protein [Streptomyces sp. DSM 40750]UUU23244.1 hypothetical protein JIX55_24795 [Streptomyces sp. DSM 40750]
MSTTPDDLDDRFTLLTAVARYDALRTRETLAAPEEEAGEGPGDPESAPLSRGDALELLALGEVIARKAVYGRQLSVRSARRAGASWAQIGAALGTTKQAAWEAHKRWIDQQAKREEDPGHWGWDENDVAAARVLAGEPGEPDEGDEGEDGSGV